MVKNYKNVKFAMIVRLFLVVSAVILVSPVVIVVALSLKNGIGTYMDFFIWEPELFYSIANSMIIASVASFGAMIFSIPAGFVLAKTQFRGRDIVFFIYIIMMIVPFQTVMLPQYVLSRSLKIYDTLAAVILPAMFSPFGVFFLTQSIKSIGNEIFEAARLETSSTPNIILYILIPMIRPAILCVWVLSFCESWNAVSEPLVFLETIEKMPMAVQLNSLSAEGVFGFAATTVFMVLPALIFRTFDDDIMEGMGELKLK